MNLPGFSAEASLERTRGVYVRQRSGSYATTGQIVAARCPYPAGCKMVCKRQCERIYPPGSSEYWDCYAGCKSSCCNQHPDCSGC